MADLSYEIYNRVQADSWIPKLEGPKISSSKVGRSFQTSCRFSRQGEEGAKAGGRSGRVETTHSEAI